MKKHFSAFLIGSLLFSFCVSACTGITNSSSSLSSSSSSSSKEATYSISKGTVDTGFDLEIETISTTAGSKAYFVVTGDDPDISVKDSANNSVAYTNEFGNRYYIIMPASNVIINVKAKSTPVKEYWTVTFDSKGGIPAEIITRQVEKNTIMLDPVLPSKEGYNFLGWYDTLNNYIDLTKAITRDYNLSAKWEIISYSISYTLNEGVLSEDNPTSYTIESDTFTLNNPTKTNYTFTGWTGTGLTEKTMLVTINKGSKGTRNYIANFELDKHSVTFNPKNGGGSTIIPVEHGSKVTKITPDPVKNGYEFKGWCKGNEETTFDFNSNITEDTVLNAKWSPITYTIEYVLDGGVISGTNPSSYNIESSDITLINPTKQSFVFTGWTGTDLDEPTTNVTISKGSTGNRTYTATYQSNVWKVTFVNGDSQIDQFVSKGEAIEQPTSPSKDGYTFAGWYLNDSLYDFSLPVTNNITLVAKWNVVNYDITYNLDEGTVSGTNPTSYNVETNTFTLINPTKTGYEFTGWTGTNLTEKTLNVSIIKGTYGDLSYTANYSVNKIKVTFDPDNGDSTTVKDVDYGSKAVAEAEPSKTGYTFDGWYLGDSKFDFNTAITSPITLKAKWNINNYTISYTLNGGSISGTNPLSYNVESDSFTLINPTKDNYTFTGWTGTGLSEPSKTVTIPTGSTGNRSYTANFSNTVYSVTFHPNNDSATWSVDVNSGSTVSDPGTISKAGYKFKGWFTDELLTHQWSFSNTVTSSMDLYAKWENFSISKNSGTGYTITCQNTAISDESVTFTVATTSGYEISSVEVKDSSSQVVALTDNKNGTYTFTMPSKNVTINVTCYSGGFDSNNIILRAPVISDEHCERTSPIDSGSQTATGIQKLITLTGQNVANYDIWLSAGDRSLTGTLAADQAWYTAYTNGGLDSASKLFFAHGNHDVYWTGCLTRQEHYNYFNDLGVYATDAIDSTPVNGNRHRVVNGVDFVAIDVQTYNGTTNPLSSETKTWAKNVFDSIDPNKPIFVLCHCTAPNTMLGSGDDENDGYWGSSNDLYEICKEYPNIILLSGHTHYDSHSERNIYQGEFTAINIPTIAGGNTYDTYFNGIFPKLADYDASGNPTYKASGMIPSLETDQTTMYTSSQAMYLEVDSHYNTRITRYDLKNNCQIGEPWIISAPKADGSHLYKYSELGRAETNEGPYFTGNATYSVLSNNTLKVDFDSFNSDSDMIYAYEVQVFNNASEASLEDLSIPTERKVMFANWYWNSTYATNTYSYTTTNAYTSNYVVRIIGIDSQGKYCIIYPSVK